MPDWKIPFPDLNSAQREAVMHGEGPLLVLAGPGSGKTAVITGRIRYLIESKHIPPEQILVLTFSKAAALSMQQRFLKMSSCSFPVNFGTFHSCFFHVLRDSRCYVNSQILTEPQKKQFIRTIVKKIIPDTGNEDAYLFLDAISYYKNTNIVDAAANLLSDGLKDFFVPVFREYEQIRKKKGLFDFDDMVYECRELFRKNTTIRTQWQNRYRYILIDEFQDINPVQYDTVKLMAGDHTSLFVVGDDDQAIYGFRGSSPECLKRFVEEYEAKVVRLRINYRSSADIIQAAHLVIGENKQRFEKEKQLPVEEDAKGAVLLTSFERRNEQYEYLQEKLQNQQDSSRETCAVLFRTNAFMQVFAVRLARNGIFFSMQEGSAGIYEHFIVKDVMAYLEVAANGGDRSLFLQIMNKPNRYLGREAFEREDSGLRDAMEYYRTGGLEDTYRRQCLEKLQKLEKHLHYMGDLRPSLAIRYLRKVVGYEQYLKAQCSNQNQLEEWMWILDWLTEDAEGFATLEEWKSAWNETEDIMQKLRKNKKEEENTAGKAKETGTIHLLTAHSSKGLEFDHVWIPDCNEKVFPHGASAGEACEEERRLFYVAMTRARKSLELLYLTGTKERPRLPSRFLNVLRNYSSSTNSSNSQLSKYSSKASATFSYSSSSSMKSSSGSSLGSSGFSL